MTNDHSGYYGGDPYYGEPDWDWWSEFDLEMERQTRFADNTIGQCVHCRSEVEDERESQCDVCKFGGEV